MSIEDIRRPLLKGTGFETVREEELLRLQLKKEKYRMKMIQWYLEARRLRKELSIDPLTKLRKGVGFEERCLEAMHDVERKRRDSSLDTEHVPYRYDCRHYVVFVDMDGLQWTNNNPNHGYNVGNELLRALANILNRWKRHDDLMVRAFSSGDEFWGLYTSTNAEDLRRLLLEDRRRFEEVVRKRFPTLAGRVSFSFGMQEVFSSQSREEIAAALEQSGREMHHWKHERKMEREVTSL